MKKSIVILLSTLLVCTISTSYGGLPSVIKKAVNEADVVAKKAKEMRLKKENDKATKELEEFLQKRKSQDEELDAFIQKRHNGNTEPEQQTEKIAEEIGLKWSFQKDLERSLQKEKLQDEDFDVFIQKKHNGNIEPEPRKIYSVEEKKGIETIEEMINDVTNSPIGRAMRKALRNSMEERGDVFYNRDNADFSQTLEQNTNWVTAYTYYDKQLQNRITFYITTRLEIWLSEPRIE